MRIMEEQDIPTINFESLYPPVMDTWGVTGDDFIEEPAPAKININIVKELTGNDSIFARDIKEQRELTRRDVKYQSTFETFLANQKFVPFVDSTHVAEEVYEFPSADDSMSLEIAETIKKTDTVATSLPEVLHDEPSPSQADHEAKLEILSRVGVANFTNHKDLLIGFADTLSKMNPDFLPGYHTQPAFEENSQPDIIEIDEPFEDDAPTESPHPPPDEKTRPVIIKLKKGFSDAQIKAFIAGVNTMLADKIPEKCQILTEDWASPNEHRPFPCIPGAKKLFARFAESGLLACLVIRGCHRAAAELYCISYIKAKVAKNGDVSFNAIDVDDFHAKVMASSIKFTEISSAKADVRKDGSKIYVST